MKRHWRIAVALGLFLGSTAPDLVASRAAGSGYASEQCKPVNEYEVNLLEIQLVLEGGEEKLKFKVDFVDDPCVCGISYTNDDYCGSFDGAKGTNYWYELTIDGSSRIDYIASVLLRDTRPGSINILVNYEGKLIGIALPQ